MAEYISINEIKNKGKLSIGKTVFVSLAQQTIMAMPDCSKTFAKIDENKLFSLKETVRVEIMHEIIHIFVKIIISRKADIHEIVSRIQDEVKNALMASLETIPFDVMVKIEEIK